MQKKLIALAVAGLVSGGAIAQSNVTIYGRANLGLDNWAATGSTLGAANDFKARNRVFDGASRIGFKGSEDLGNGLKANFQIESGANMDTGSTNGQSGTANTSTGTLATRMSYVGLAGHFGEVRLGRQEVHWTGGRINDIGANELGQGGPISSGSQGLVGGPAARVSNVLSYWTPAVSGFQGTVFYSPYSEAAAAGVDPNGRLWSVAANYNNGPIALKYDHTVVRIANTLVTGAPATGAPQNTGDKLMGAYFYQGESKVGLAFNHNTNAHILATSNAIAAGVAVAGNSLTQNSWALNWEHYFGNVETIVEVGQAGAVSGGITTTPNETKYKELTLAVRYLFSKRTKVYASMTKDTNGAQNYADSNAAGYSSAATQTFPLATLGAANRGADVRFVAIGLMHDF